MRVITDCRSCGGEVEDFLDLGEQYTSDFREDDSKPPAYPIVACICKNKDCMLVQLRHTTPSHEMYHDNYGFKSGVSNSIKDDLKDIVSTALEYKDDVKRWLDIASNDGTLLSFVPNSIYRVGVDPVTFLCKEAEQNADKIVNDFFSAEPFAHYEAGNGEKTYDKFDIITSISCFYDMDDPNKFVADVNTVLAPEGVWVIQQNYLLPTMELNAVDNFCHEHIEYYTLLSLESLLERHGLEVIDLSTSMVNGGSLRTVVAKMGVYDVQPTVQQQREIEEHFSLHTMRPYKRFASDVNKGLRELKLLVKDLVKDGKSVCILAASTRGSTIWQAAGLDEKLIDYAVERNPAKVGKYFSAVGVAIVSEEGFRADKPDFAIIGPWFFADEIIKREQEYVKQGGSLILPLPKLEVINARNIDSFLRKTK